MVAFFYVYQSRQTLLTFKAAANLWQEDRWKPLVAGAFNLTVNISLVVFLPEAYKLDGVILSTVLSFVLIQIPWESHVMFTRFFGSLEAREYWRVQAVSILKTVALSAASWGVASSIPVSGATGLLVKGAASAAFVAVALAVLFRSEVVALCRRIMHRSIPR